MLTFRVHKREKKKQQILASNNHIFISNFAPLFLRIGFFFYQYLFSYMSKFDNGKFKELLTTCNLAHKRVLKKELTRNRLKYIEYTTILVESYNDLSAYIYKFFSTFTPDNQEILRNHWINNRDKLTQCFGKILNNFEIPREISEQIELRTILRTNFSETELTQYGNSIPDLNLPTNSRNTDTESLHSETGSTAGSLTDLLNIENIPVSNMNPPMSRIDFLNLASKTINRNYDGDPLSLQAFINSIELLEDFADDNLQPTFCRFVKSKLDKRAMECVPATANTIQDIIGALKNGIKPDNSKVIAGRILALKPDRSKLNEFSHNAEELAEAFQRSLIIEGIPHEKAKEMTVEKTVELCRNAARSDLVKSVLAASRFDSPKEVIAKYLVENATESNEKQILAYKRFNNNNRPNNNNRGNFRNFNNRFNNNGRGNFQSNNRGNFQNNNRGNFRNNNRGNFRGNNNNNRFNNNGRNNYYNNNNRNNNNDNNNRFNNVRYAGNGEAPQAALGDVQNDHVRLI